MYYEINVALNGKHFFATAERSITDLVKLEHVYTSFKSKFPESEGYSILVKEVKTIGKHIDMEGLEIK